LNRPAKRNAQNPLTWAWLSRTVNALPGTVRMLVVRGEGPSFSAGLDRAMFTPEGVDGIPGVHALARAGHDEASAEIAGYQQGLGVFARPGLVSLALVQGHAVGAGFQLSLACDVRIAAEDAQFSMAEVTLGLVPDLGGTKRLVELVGYSRAAEICLTGRRVDAAEALRIGLVSTVVGGDELAEAGERFVTRILEQPVTAVTEIKALLLAAADRTQAEQERAEREAQHRQLRALAGLSE
jgi:enoyl-CoA hydratase/carnithine racemase